MGRKIRKQSGSLLAAALALSLVGALPTTAAPHGGESDGSKLPARCTAGFDAPSEIDLGHRKATPVSTPPAIRPGLDRVPVYLHLQCQLADQVQGEIPGVTFQQ